jgi:hypothetical protein
MAMLTRSEVAGMEEADNWKKQREGKRYKRSGEEWSFHALRAFKCTLIREQYASGKETIVTSFLSPWA